MSREFKNIKGTFDILPFVSDAEGTSVPSSRAWQFVEERIREVMAGFDVHEIRTPILEPTELIARGVGLQTDIVTKEMFAFERGKTAYVLRPEVTAPVMRAYMQHRLDQAGGAQRLYYIGPCFRAERPQKGRFRQFHQFGVEFVGSTAPVADAEAIALMSAVYSGLGVNNTRLRINTLGDESSRPLYREKLRAYLQPYAGELTESSRQRLDVNPLRILDTKVPHEQSLLADAPKLIDCVDERSIRHYEAVKTLLSDINIDFVEDPMLVRGLDYYTQTAFELESPHLGAQSALAGGGRYDLLSVQIGSKKPIPAVGFAAGMERLFLALDAAGKEEPPPRRLDVFVVALGADAVRKGFEIAQSLRGSGLVVAYDLLARSMKAQMREANRRGARFTVILGADELGRGLAEIKNMETGEQEAVEISNIGRYLA